MAYQGWKNWETWNIALWFGNDEGLYRTVLDYRGKFNSAKAKDFVLETLPEGTPDMKDLSPGKLHTAYSIVSWREIADAFNEMKGD
jgi:hypothetical protein